MPPPPIAWRSGTRIASHHGGGGGWFHHHRCEDDAGVTLGTKRSVVWNSLLFATAPPLVVNNLGDDNNLSIVDPPLGMVRGWLECLVLLLLLLEICDLITATASERGRNEPVA